MHAIWSDKYGVYLFDSDYLKKQEEMKTRKPDVPKTYHFNIIEEFIDQFCEYDPNADAVCGIDLYGLYCKFCEKNNYQFMTISGFIRDFKIIIVREEYIKGIQFSKQVIYVKRPDKPTMRYSVTYFHNIKINKGE